VVNFVCRCLALWLAVTTAQAPEPKIVTDVRDAAEWMAEALPGWGYRGDFSVESLKDIDRFVDEQFPNGRPKPSDLLARDLGARIFALGAYVGETIRRQGEGRWLASQGDPEDVINLTVKLKSGSIFWPMQRIMKRLQNGPEDGIYVYGGGILNRLSSSTGSLPSNDQRE
jgi:hypothetical protein